MGKSNIKSKNKKITRLGNPATMAFVFIIGLPSLVFTTAYFVSQAYPKGLGSQLSAEQVELFQLWMYRVTIFTFFTLIVAAIAMIVTSFSVDDTLSVGLTVLKVAGFIFLMYAIIELTKSPSKLEGIQDDVKAIREELTR